MAFDKLLDLLSLARAGQGGSVTSKRSFLRSTEIVRLSQFSGGATFMPMLKKSSLRRLLDEYVVPTLIDEFSNLGWRYLKVQHEFRRELGPFAASLDIKPSGVALINEEFSLEVRCTTGTRGTDYPVWHKKTLGCRDAFEGCLDTFAVRWPLPLESVSRDDILKGKSARFKENIRQALMNEIHELPRISDQELITGLARRLATLESSATFENMVGYLESCEHINCGFVLASLGEQPRAEAHLRRSHSQLVGSLDDPGLDAKRRRARIIGANELSAQAARIGLELGTIADDEANSKVETPSGPKRFGGRFVEAFRLTQLARRPLDVFPEPETQTTIISWDEGYVSVHDRSGVEKHSFQMRSRDHFRAPNDWCPPIERAPDGVTVNNHLLTKDRSWIEFPHAVQLPKKPKYDADYNLKQSLQFLPRTGCYAGLYGWNKNNEVWLFSKKGEFQRRIKLEEPPFLIIPESETVVTFETWEHVRLWTLEGVELGRFRSKNPSPSSIGWGVALSPCSEFMVIWGYHAKSQLYCLSAPAKPLLNFELHPMRNREYAARFKERQLTDNRCTNVVAFSPDGSYFVAGGLHGRLAKWTVPHLKRQDVTPTAEYVATVTDAELLETKKGTFFLTKHSVNHVQFLEGGKQFVVEIGDDLLCFSADLEHLWTEFGQGRTRIRDTHGAVVSGDEVVVFF